MLLSDEVESLLVTDAEARHKPKGYWVERPYIPSYDFGIELGEGHTYRMEDVWRAFKLVGIIESGAPQ